MSKKLNLLAKLREKKVKPFLTYTIYGINNCLAVEDEGAIYPLLLNIKPPTRAYMLESEHLTGLVLRFTEGYEDEIAKAQGANSAEAAQKIQKDIIEAKKKELIEGGLLEGLREADRIREIGDYILRNLLESIQYTEDDETTPAVVVDEAEHDLSATPVKIGIHCFKESERMEIGMSLLSTLEDSKTQDAQIPITSTEQAVNPTTGDLQENEVMATVSASKSGEVLKDIRKVSSQAIPKERD